MNAAEANRVACDLCRRENSDLAPVRVQHEERTFFPQVCAVCRRRGEWAERAFAGLKWCPIAILAVLFLVPGFTGWPLIVSAVVWLAAFRFVVWYQLPRRILRRAQELAQL